MKEKILTDTTLETVKVRWDGERFGIVHLYKVCDLPSHIILLNPKEMLDLVEFAGKLGRE